MNNDDFLYGSRSGIQKAIRRGDLDLAHTCFDALWSESVHRNWLFWRATSLVTEEAWQMAGELGELLKSGAKDERTWRRFIYRLTLATKSKDAGGLLFLLLEDRMPDTMRDLPECIEMDAWLAMAREEDQEEVEFLVLADLMFDAYTTDTEKRKLSEYEREAFNVLRERTKMGGMLGDRQVCLSAMLLIFLRGIDKKKIDADIKSRAEAWKGKNGRKKPRTVNLPWYVFDMHTQAGKIALGIFMRHKAEKYSINKTEFARVWFFLESAKNPVSFLSLPKDKSNPTCFDSIWWVSLLKSSCVYSNYRAKEVRNIWVRTMREDIRGAVSWILEKRDGGSR